MTCLKRVLALFATQVERGKVMTELHRGHPIPSLMFPLVPSFSLTSQSQQEVLHTAGSALQAERKGQSRPTPQTVEC